MSEDLGRWKWKHDTLAAAMVMEASMRSVKVPIRGNFCYLLRSPLVWSAGFEVSIS